MTGEGAIEKRTLIYHYEFPVKVQVFASYREVLGLSGQAVLDEVFELMHVNYSRFHIGIRGERCTFAIAFQWGSIDQGTLVSHADFYCFYFDRPWNECNPKWRCYAFSNEIPTNGFGGCEADLIILGKEAELRRKIAAEGGSLGDYLQAWPDLGELRKKVQA